ncbi:MAG TPA: DUF1631 family protein, partial [Casimicrobiaceae bacterium]|nr:DUF1631 family protein [Casimicrobiaceae bacterium]
MNADATSDRTAPEQLVVGFDGAQDVAPAKADRVLRECLSLTHKRLEAAIWSALEELQDAAPQYEDDAPPVPGTSKLGRDMASAVRRQRAQFFPRFKAEFDKAFQKRREGKRRTRMQRDNASLAFASTALAIVDHGDHSAQVALKSVVLAMRDATQEDALAFDFRVRVLLREVSEVGTFDNPWSADYYCDAFGNACRGLWPEGELWRPIMDHLVRVTTPHVAALHRELNVLLQDRDVLPAVRLRTHARGGAAQPADLGGRALYDKLVEILDPGTRAAPSAATGMPETAEGTGAVVETASGNTPAGFEAG